MDQLLSAAVDIERITRDMDYRALQDNITNIAFCDIERELVSKNMHQKLVIRLSIFALCVLISQLQINFRLQW